MIEVAIAKAKAIFQLNFEGDVVCSIVGQCDVAYREPTRNAAGALIQSHRNGCRRGDA